MSVYNMFVLFLHLPSFIGIVQFYNYASFLGNQQECNMNTRTFFME